MKSITNKTKKAILIIILMSLYLQLGAQTNYYDFSEQAKENIFFENFSNNNYGWFVGNSGNCQITKYYTGYYELQSICTGYYSSVNFNTSGKFVIDQGKDFEIEASLMFVRGEDNNANSIRWGQNAEQTSRLLFGISGNGKYIFSKCENGSWTNLINWTESSYIKQSSYNKLTIRKIANKYYFFINEAYVNSYPFVPFFGQQLALVVNQNSVMRVNFVKISYLKQKVFDDIQPVIVIKNPKIGNGGKISTNDSQINIIGFASDNIAIKEVTVNGNPVNLDLLGNFEYPATLETGNNHFFVKASDNVNNSFLFSFIVEKEQSQTNFNIVPKNNEKRLALVIGNSNYNEGQYLKNPENDAELMKSTLMKLGFTVISKKDATKYEIEQAVKEFSKKLPDYNVALFYYAGHGLQVDGQNYLIPVDAKLVEKNDCKFEAVPVRFIVEEFEAYPNNINIVILDACRNNPFRSWARGTERGFKAISPSTGTIISFATSEGATASDGEGSNGLFTEELVKQMMIPQPIETVFKRTRAQVIQRSKGVQSPQEWSQLIGDFYFLK